MKSGITDVTVNSAEAMNLVCSKVSYIVWVLKRGRHTYDTQTQDSTLMYENVM